MFKKRERPGGGRARDDGEGDGECGAVPAAPSSLKRPGSAHNFGEAKGIGATTRRGDADAAAKLEARGADSTFGGIQASNQKQSVRPADDAVRLLETETPVDRDIRAMHERNQKIHEALKKGELTPGVYRGMGGYKQYAERSEGAISASKYSGLLGPTRGMSNVRSISRIEYWAASSGTDGGICKDYKEAGYCGFGDSCIYLHDRSDYKSGHLLEKEFEDKQKAIEEKKRKRWEKKALQQAKRGEDGDGCVDSDGSSSGSDEGALPSACPICNTRWADCKSIPIQTVCGHHFCQDCAFENFAKSPKCMICDAPTQGIFNSCEALEDKIKQQKAAKIGEARKRQKQAQAAVPYNISLET